MNRLKFRVWDIQCGCMIEQNLITISGEGYIQIYDPAGDMWHDANENSEINLMQSTGIKDNYGDYIYEGDIIKYKDWFGDEWEWATAKIIWKESQAQFFPDILDNFWPSDVEVIGNIYENPELIES